MNLSERIRTVLTEQGIDQVELARIAGVTKGAVNQWLDGKIQSLKLEYAVGIQTEYGYSAVWLVLGRGEKMIDKIRIADDFVPIPITSKKAIPVRGMAQLGDNGFWVPIEYPAGHGDGYIDFPTGDPDAYALKCVGDSMLPRIKDGEFVIVEPAREALPGDEVLVKAKDGRVMVKELAYCRDEKYFLLSTNASHEKISIRCDEVENLHYVVAIVKKAMWRPD